MVDFTGGTWRSLIDGSEVSAIPDSALIHIDPLSDDLDDGESFSTLTDFSGEDNNLSGSGGTFIEDARNSNPAYHFVDSDYSLDWGVQEQPFTMVAVVQMADNGDRNDVAGSSEEGDNRGHFSQYFEDDNWEYRIGEDRIEGSSTTTDWIVATSIANGSDSVIRVNGSDIVTGSLGFDMEGIQVGSSYLSAEPDVKIGQFIFAEEDLRKTDELEAEEARQANLFDVSLD